MELPDALFLLRVFAAVVGVCLVGRVLYPLVAEYVRERRKLDEDLAVDACIEQLERCENGARK